MGLRAAQGRQGGWRCWPPSRKTEKRFTHYWASPLLKADKEVVLAAVNEDGLAH